MAISFYERNASRPDIDCPGDRLSYNCSIKSNSETIHHLEWNVTYPGYVPIIITHDGNTILNNISYFGMGISAVMTDYMANEYIESIITITVLDNNTDKIEVGCSIRGLASAMITVVNTSGTSVYTAIS